MVRTETHFVCEGENVQTTYLKTGNSTRYCPDLKLFMQYHFYVGNAIFQVLAAALYKTQRLVKTDKINLGANLYFCAFKFAETDADALFHKLPACAGFAVRRRCYHPANAGFGKLDARRKTAGIGQQ